MQQNHSEQDQPEKTAEATEPDFFSNLQKNEKQKGKAARGKGHGWVTLAETLMGDW